LFDAAWPELYREATAPGTEDRRITRDLGNSPRADTARRGLGSPTTAVIVVAELLLKLADLPRARPLGWRHIVHCRSSDSSDSSARLARVVAVVAAPPVIILLGLALAAPVIILLGLQRSPWSSSLNSSARRDLPRARPLGWQSVVHRWHTICSSDSSARLATVVIAKLLLKLDRRELGWPCMAHWLSRDSSDPRDRLSSARSAQSAGHRTRINGQLSCHLGGPLLPRLPLRCLGLSRS